MLTSNLDSFFVTVWIQVNTAVAQKVLPSKSSIQNCTEFIYIYLHILIPRSNLLFTISFALNFFERFKIQTIEKKNPIQIIYSQFITTWFHTLCKSVPTTLQIQSILWFPVTGVAYGSWFSIIFHFYTSTAEILWTLCEMTMYNRV